MVTKYLQVAFPAELRDACVLYIGGEEPLYTSNGSRESALTQTSIGKMRLGDSTLTSAAYTVLVDSESVQ
jgi:hypothetical protein